MVPEPVRSPWLQPLSIGPTLSEIAGMLTVAAAIRQAGMVLSQPVSSTTPSSGVAVEHLDERQIGEVAVEAGGRALAGLLDRMARELEADAAGRRDALAHALRELEVVAVAGREVGAGLGDADDRLARLQLLRASGRNSGSARDRARSCPGLSGLSNHRRERSLSGVIRRGFPAIPVLPARPASPRHCCFKRPGLWTGAQAEINRRRARPDGG